MSSRSLVVVACSLVAGMGALDAQTWPGGAPPCDGTLQACVTGVPSGATITLVTNGPIAEFITVTDKTVTMVAGAGFTPELTGGIDAVSTTAAAAITVDGLQFADASVRGLAGQGNVAVTVRHCTLAAHNRDAVSAFSTGSPGTATVEVTDNLFAVSNDPGFEGSAVNLSQLANGGSLRMLRNVVSQLAGDSIGAVSFYESEGSFDFLIQNNEIGRAGSNRGVFLRADEASNVVTADIFGNLIAGSASSSGAGIFVSAPAAGATVGVNLINNTVVGGNSGVQIGGGGDAGAISGLVANNILAHHSLTGYGVEDAFDAAVINRFNLFFATSTSETLGAGSLTGDPSFAGVADYRLLASSIARDAGQNSDVPGGLTADLDLHPRILGGTVDLGAYEVAPSVVEIPTFVRRRARRPDVAVAGRRVPPAADAAPALPGRLKLMFQLPAAACRGRAARPAAGAAGAESGGVPAVQPSASAAAAPIRAAVGWVTR